MDTQLHSLITRDEEQLKLLQDDAVFASEEHEPRNPTFTAERLFLRNPDKYKLIVGLSGMGIGAIRASKMLNVSVNTVLAVREKEGDKVEIEKKRWGRLTRAASMLCLDIIIERLSTEPADETLKDLAITYGILTEKAELLMGGPTARIETREGKAVTHQDVLDYLHDLRSMGLKEEMGEQRAPDVDGNGAAIGVIGTDSPAPAGDEKRPIKGLLPAVCEMPRAVGQTPHRSDDMPVNIDQKQGDSIDVGIIIPSDLENGKAST
jgi:hypothetical protein